MLIKGTLKGNILSTNTGNFHVALSEAFSDAITGIFELSKITSDSFERKVSIEGYETLVKIPIIKAEVTRIYSLCYENGEVSVKPANIQNETTTMVLGESLVKPQEEAVTDLVEAAKPEPKPEPKQVKQVSKTRSKEIPPQADLSGLGEESEHTDTDEAIELFGKPLTELGDTYHLDHSVGRDVIKRIFQFFQKKGVKLDAKTQSFDLRGLAA